MPRRSNLGRAIRPAGVLLAVAVLLVSCGPPETDPDALRRPDGAPLYRDGVYAASFSHTGPDGWLGFLRLRVRAGLIDEVCFNAVNVEEVRLTSDEAFTEHYLLETGVDLEGYLEDLAAQVLETQQAGMRIDPRSMTWAVRFDTLLRTALASARRGVTVDAEGMEYVATAGPYIASDAPDALGWRAELVLVYDAGGAVAGAFREIRRELDGSERLKRDDAGYQQRFSTASGVTTAEVTATLLEQLFAGESSGIDGVTGATLTSRRFVELVRRIEGHRRPVQLPRDLCR